MQTFFNFTKLAVLGTLLATRVAAVDIQYCHGGYPQGVCQVITLTSTASTCYAFNAAVGGIDTVVSITSGIKYILYTGAGCTGSPSAAFGVGSNTLVPPFLNNVRSVVAQLQAAPPWQSLGCYTDFAGGRTLAAFSTVNSGLTVESCQAYCYANGYNYAGVEYGKECYCDYSIRPPGVATDPTSCNVKCSGNQNQTCGGVSRINVYWNGKPGPANPATVGAGAFTYRGCYTDNVNNTRSLLARYDIASGGVTPENCAAVCKSNGHTIVGLEYGQECWCGGVLSSTSTKVAEDNCRTACKANPAFFCGDPNRLNIWSAKVL